MELTAKQKAHKLVADNKEILIRRFMADDPVHTAKELSQITVENVIDNIPMYTGTLNPKWEHWNDVRAVLNAL